MKRIFFIITVLVGLNSPAFAQKKPAFRAKPAVASASASILKGKSIYAQYCLSCHQVDGGGVDGLNPPLTKTDYVLGDKIRLVNVLVHGLKGVDVNGEEYHNNMPSQDFLNDQQMADVLTYVRNSFGNKASAVTVAEVKSVRTTTNK